jgi:hypothetical protein
VGPRVSLDDMERWKFLTLPGLNCDPSVTRSVASRCNDCATVATFWDITSISHTKHTNLWFNDSINNSDFVVFNNGITTK